MKTSDCVRQDELMTSFTESFTEAIAGGLPNRGRAKGGYICYARKGAPSNAASSHAGHGASPREAALAALYWANQGPWVVVVPASKASQWARDEADAAAQDEVLS